MCVKADKVLPSIEHFQERLKSPRVYFLFYHYFVKAVMGESNWTTSLGGNKKLATSVAEAYTHSLIENNYFAWLFEYKERASVYIKTEYDSTEDEDGDDEEWKDDLYMPGELNAIEISIPTTDDGEFKLVTKEDDEAEYKRLREERKGTHDDVKDAATSPEFGHKQQHDEMKETLEAFRRENDMMGDKEKTTKKRYIMRDLKSFSRQRGKNIDKFIFETAESVKKESKSKKKFQAAYRNLLKTMEANVNKENIATDKYKMNCNAFYNDDDDDDDA